VNYFEPRNPDQAGGIGQITDAEPGGSALLQQALEGGAWIKESKQAVKMTRLS
jgi:hypothetical protein